MDTLESIISDLLRNVFESSVSQEDLAERLLHDGGHDFHKLDSKTILDALRDNDISQESWNNINFSCDEVLAYYWCILKDSPIKEGFPANCDDEIRVCGCILALGLFAESGRRNGSHLNTSQYKVLSILAIYSDYIPNMHYLDEVVERLLFFIFRR